MGTQGSIPTADSRLTIAGDLGRCALWVGWQCIRLPLFLFLLVLEPVVTFVLGALALLGVWPASTTSSSALPHRFCYRTHVVASRSGLPG